MGQGTEKYHQKPAHQKNCNYRQLASIKCWNNVVQQDQVGQMWINLEGAADTEDARVIL